MFRCVDAAVSPVSRKTKCEEVNHMSDERRRWWRRLLAVSATIALAALGLPAGTAHAELTHPRQQWLRDSTAGLFLHWGMRTSPSFTSCTAWESAVNSGGWTANYWVAEAQKLHA